MRLLGLLRGVTIAAALMTVLGGMHAIAADYPKKPVRIIIPYDAGGAADLQARILASTAPQYLGQAILASNRTGAGGVTGSNYVVRSKPDGYTLLLARVGSQAGVPAINPSIPYKWNDYTFLGLLEKNPFVLAVNAKSDLKSLDDIKAKLKAGKKLSYSTGGVGTLPHIAMVMVLDGMGLGADAMTHVPYKGGGAAAAALVGGHVDMFFQNLSGLVGQIQAGTLRALLVTTPDRVKVIKDVPTAKEAGRPDLELAIGWSALYGPPGMPKEIVGKWVDVLQKVKGDKSWNKMTTKLGSIPAISSPQEMEAFAESQFKAMRKVAEKVGMVIKKK
ncbi:MAG: tripartite tricarboxylate transporter substrate binding protein [Alphaproteobacteria bacterium]|nr:tripartite tricarboxylate transporter substrate binding protein [Alphaproteobacteria bacterium]